MLKDWIEVFKSGTHTDASGNVKTWSEADLDTIVGNYNPANHEAPVVVGHPKDNAPAFAWVESLKREGSTLFAKLKDIVPEFQEAVDLKMYKKRSIALYPDLSLRHLGFLGGMPPAVKGLADFAFQDAPEFMEFMDWEDMQVADLFSNLREWMITEKGLDVADRVLPVGMIDNLKTSAAMPEPCELAAPSPMYSEGDPDPNVAPVVVPDPAVPVEPAAEVIDPQDPDPRDVELAEARSALAAEQKKTRTMEFDLFCESLVVDGKLPPGMKAGACEFLELTFGVQTFEFAEGEGSALDRMKSFLAALPKRLPAPGEFVEGETDVVETDPNKLADQAKEFQESEKQKGRIITMSAAVHHISKKGE